MNSLNSVLLEGTVTVDAWESDAGRCRFWISSTCEEGENRQESKFQAEAQGRLAQTCLENCRVGRSLRLVGRLKTEPEGVIIIAEHVELSRMAT